MKRRLSIPHLSETYDFILHTDTGLISHVTCISNGGERSEVLYEQVPEIVKKQLNKQIELESEENDND